MGMEGQYIRYLFPLSTSSTSPLNSGDTVMEDREKEEEEEEDESIWKSVEFLVDETLGKIGRKRREGRKSEDRKEGREDRNEMEEMKSRKKERKL